MTLSIHFLRTSTYVAFANEIRGFRQGISLEDCGPGQVHRNRIDDCAELGIEIENGNTGITVSENIITLDASDFGFQVGILFVYDLPFVAISSTSIESNCIYDTDVAIWLNRIGVGQIGVPRIYNNFLYNYTILGLFSNSMFGPIGTGTACNTEAVLGRNSFITNRPVGFGFFPQK